MAVRVAGRGVELDGDELVAELLAQPGEPFLGDGPVPREPQSEHAEVGLIGAPLLDAGEVVVGETEVAPTTPTPAPPHSSCACLANARSHTVTGLARFVAKAANSEDTHAGTSDRAM